MGVKKYYSTKDGKKVHVGWLAQLIIDGKCIDHVIIHDKRSKSKAEYWLEQKKIAIKRGTFDACQMTVLQVFDAYLARKGWDDLADGSKWYWNRAYASFKLLDEKWLNCPVTDLSGNKLFALLESLKKTIANARATKPRKNFKCELAFLSATLNFYRDRFNSSFVSPITKTHRLEFGNAANGKRRSNKIKVALDFSQINFLLKNLREKSSSNPKFEVIYYFIVRIQLIYGFRLGEAVGLEWDDVDFEKMLIRLRGTIEWMDQNGKTKRNCKVYRLKEEGQLQQGEFIEYPITPEVGHLLQEVRDLKRSDRWVMANRKGDVPQYSKIRQRLMKTGFFGEIGQCSHKVRKTACTIGHLLTDAKASSDLLRHANSQVTDRYLDDAILAKHNPIPRILSQMTNG